MQILRSQRIDHKFKKCSQNFRKWLLHQPRHTVQRLLRYTGLLQYTCSYTRSLSSLLLMGRPIRTHPVRFATISWGGPVVCLFCYSLGLFDFCFFYMFLCLFIFSKQYRYMFPNKITSILKIMYRTSKKCSCSAIKILTQLLEIGHTIQKNYS